MRQTCVTTSYSSFVLVSHGVIVSEISPAEIAVTITLPYCLKSIPLKSLIEIIVKVRLAKIVQYFNFMFSFSVLFVGSLSIAKAINASALDSKWVELQGILKSDHFSPSSAGEAEKLIIFTEHFTLFSLGRDRTCTFCSDVIAFLMSLV